MFPDFQFSNESLDSSGEGGGPGGYLLWIFLFFFFLFDCHAFSLFICLFGCLFFSVWLYCCAEFYYRCLCGLYVPSRSWVSDRFLFIFGIQIFARESLRCRPRDGVISDVS